MNSRQKPNAMLIELVIVILFFAISAGIILQLFAATHSRNQLSQNTNAATLAAEDIAERFARSKAPAEDFLTGDGFEGGPDSFEKQLETPGGKPLTATVTASNSETEAGTLSTLDIVLSDGTGELIRLPAARYIPKEARP